MTDVRPDALLSVVVPVYNENRTIHRVLEIIRSVPVKKEIIVVDDGSNDGTREILAARAPNADTRVIYHEKNQGKGSAVRTGIRAATGDVVIVQDADLEYDPMEYPILIDELRRSGSNVVYGSRFLGKKDVSSFWHRSINQFLTFLTNVLYGSRLTDMETCYKLYRTDFLKALPIRSSGFEIEVELTAKTLLRGEKIVEVPISYKGRSFHEGKKIGWKDGFRAVFSLFRYRFFGSA